MAPARVRRPSSRAALPEPAQVTAAMAVAWSTVTAMWESSAQPACAKPRRPTVPRVPLPASASAETAWTATAATRRARASVRLATPAGAKAPVLRLPVRPTELVRRAPATAAPAVASVTARTPPLVATPGAPPCVAVRAATTTWRPWKPPVRATGAARRSSSKPVRRRTPAQERSAVAAAPPAPTARATSTAPAASAWRRRPKARRAPTTERARVASASTVCAATRLAQGSARPATLSAPLAPARWFRVNRTAGALLAWAAGLAARSATEPASAACSPAEPQSVDWVAAPPVCPSTLRFATVPGPASRPRRPTVLPTYVMVMGAARAAPPATTAPTASSARAARAWFLRWTRDPTQARVAVAGKPALEGRVAAAAVAQTRRAPAAQRDSRTAGSMPESTRGYSSGCPTKTAPAVVASLAIAPPGHPARSG